MIPRKFKFIFAVVAAIVMYHLCDNFWKGENWIPDDIRDQLVAMNMKMQQFHDLIQSHFEKEMTEESPHDLHQDYKKPKEKVKKALGQVPGPLKSITSNLDVANGRLVSSNNIPVKVILLVGSTARSGTSFTGELLSMQNDSIYLFEPTHFIRFQTGKKIEEADAMSHIKDVIHCHFKNTFVEWIQYRDVTNVVRSPKITQFLGKKHWRSYLTASFLTKICRESSIRVIKVIRVRMAWVRVLLDDPQLDVKIIHLVRDPRASLFSIFKNKLSKLDPYYHCPRIKADLLETPKLIGQYPDRVMKMSYEKFCLDTFGKATEIWRFLTDDNQANLPLRWAAYLQEHTKVNTQNVGTYTTMRNSSEEYQLWRWEITESALLFIEKQCETVIKILRYNIFGSYRRVRDASVSMFLQPPKW